jgi:hypothetical protein
MICGGLSDDGERWAGGATMSLKTQVVENQVVATGVGAGGVTPE